LKITTKGVWTMNELTYTMVGDYSLPNRQKTRPETEKNSDKEVQE
jgi:hypothetical protein